MRGVCLALMLCSLALSGCSTSSVFEPYPKQIQPVKNATEQQNYQTAEAQLVPHLHSNDWQLYALELGRIQELAGQYQQSIATFTPVIAAVEQELLAPKIQGSILLAASGSLMTNDNALPYRLKGYEIILLYQYQALNYLAINDLQDALVAFRRANELQGYLETQYQQQITDAQTEAEQKQLNPDMSQEAMLQSTVQLAAGVKSSFQNGLSYFLASFAFAAAGDFNDAVVAMKKALETAPNNSFAQSTLVQLLREQGGGGPAQQSGQIVVLWEEDFIPPMQQVAFSLPLPGFGSAQYFVFPIYAKTPPVSTLWQLSVDGQAVKSPELILSLGPLAAKALSEQYPLIFTRQALRILLQAGLVGTAEKSDHNENDQTQNNMIGLIATAYSYLMGNADLRSWLLLPANVRVGVYSVPAGAHELVFNARQDQAISVKVQPGQTVLVWVNAEGGTLSSQISVF